MDGFAITARHDRISDMQPNAVEFKLKKDGCLKAVNRREWKKCALPYVLITARTRIQQLASRQLNE